MDKETEDDMERRLREAFDKRVPERWFDWRGLQTNGTFFEQSSAPSSPFNCLFVDEAQKQNCVEHLCTKARSAATNSERDESSEKRDEAQRETKAKSEEEDDDDEEEEESESEESDDNSDGVEQEDFRQKVLNNQRHRQLQLLRQGNSETHESSAPERSS